MATNTATMSHRSMEMAYTSSTEWRSVRPWSLALSVREITSVSATFVISSSLSSNGTDPSLASLGLTTDDISDYENDDERLTDGDKDKTLMGDALAKGLSVNVNGAPWQRVLIRIDDHTDEAVIVIYGLMPGIYYDIDLGLVRGGQNSTLRGQITTQGESLASRCFSSILRMKLRY